MKTKSFPDTSNRDEKHRDPDVWFTEPFDEELELWTLADKHGFGFAWVLMPAAPDTPRCREIGRAEGIATIRDEWDADQERIVIAGTMIGSSFDIEVANLTMTLNSDLEPVDLSETFELIARVCERMKALQLYDGSEIFDAEDTSCTPFGALIGIALKKT